MSNFRDQAANSAAHSTMSNRIALFTATERHMEISPNVGSLVGALKNAQLLANGQQIAKEAELKTREAATSGTETALLVRGITVDLLIERRSLLSIQQRHLTTSIRVQLY